MWGQVFTDTGGARYGRLPLPSSRSEVASGDLTPYVASGDLTPYVASGDLTP
jgi:hypothetical protein